MPQDTIYTTNIAQDNTNIGDIINEGIDAIAGDTLDFDNEISSLTSLIHGLVKQCNINAEQFKSVMACVFNEELNEEDPMERTILTEGDNVKNFINTNHR